jgi:uncharacterized protein (DUF2147 family)
MQKYLILLFFSLSFTAKSTGDKAIIGLYYSPEKDAKIEIYQQDNRYFGKFVWLEIGDKDVNNPNPELRSRELLGMTFINNFRFEDQEYTDGKIYDPQSGETYDAILWLEGKDLMLRGFIGFSIFGRTEKFTRIK